MRILIAEDQPQLNRSLTKALTAAGWSVDAVSDGGEALLYLEGADYDAVVLAVLVLAAALTACGAENPNNTGTADQDRPGTNQSQNAQRDDGAGGSWQNGTDTPAQPGASVDGAAGSQENTRDNARMGRSALRRGAESTATFRQMLENGYVHDSDGFLNDGENTSW